jgi:hypothetical protein
MTVSSGNPSSQESPKPEKLGFWTLNCGSLVFIAVSVLIGAFGFFFYAQLMDPNGYTGTLGPIAVALFLIFGSAGGAVVGLVLVIVALMTLAWKGKM